MKKLNRLVLFFISIIVLSVISCSTLNGIIGEPKISVSSVSIKSIDFEGITFTCDYTITNPYPVAFSIDKVEADVSCSEKSIVKLAADEGISVAAVNTRKNAFTFKVPYSAIMNFASEYSAAKKSLPFTIAGNAYLDLSKSTGLELKSLRLPFSVSFEVPVFKPSFSISNPRIKMMSTSELKEALVNGGIPVAKAVTIAAQLASGKKLSENFFDGIDLNLKFNFDLNIKNEGFSAWQCSLDKCSIKTSGNDLIDIALNKNEKITGSSAKVPVTATLNTLKAGKFIVQLLNKSGKDPVFSVDSKLAFPELKYKSDIPLAYSCAIPLSKISK